jgi:tRNA A-37 threonylcarbamoyl transferase component Bud32
LSTADRVLDVGDLCLGISQNGSPLSEQFQSAVDLLISNLSGHYSITGATTGIKNRHCRIDHHQFLNCIEFIYFVRRGWSQPRSGWKLHLSSNIAEAVEGLRSFPALAQRFQFSFKIPATTTDFVLINSGQEGGTQAGKIITIYPDQSHFEELAASLSELWPARNGPRVIFDYAHKKHSRIFARSGSFVATHTFDSYGQRQPAITGTAGLLEQDIRGKEPNPEVIPPADFYFHSLVTQWPVRGNKGAYFATSKINETGRSAVHLGFDVENRKTVIIKILRKGIGSDISDISLCDRTPHEYELTLQSIKLGLSVPKPIEYFCLDEFCFLIFQDEELRTIEDAAGDLGVTRRKIELIPFLIDSIRRLHAANIIHNDISWRNVMIRPDGTGVLIDFGAAIRSAGAKELFDWDRSRLTGCIAECAFAAQFEISCASHAEFILNSLLIEKFCKTALMGKIILERRWPNDKIIRDSQREIENRGFLTLQRGSPLRMKEQYEWRSWVRSKVDYVLRSVELFLSRNSSHTWQNASGLHHNFPAFELGVGEAGIAYGLALIATLTGNSRADELAEATLQTMLRQQRSPMPGLIFGNGGVLLVEAILRERYSRPVLTTFSDHDLASNSDFDDLYFGNAGRLFALCALQRSNLIDRSCSKIIREIAYDIKAKASNTDGAAVWSVSLPPGGEKRFHLGFAHGAIGILYSLQSAAEALNDGELSEWVLDSVRRIAEDSIRRGGLRFHIGSPKLAPPLNLCNGLLGILWCFGDKSIGCELISRIAAHCLLVPAFNNPTYCHGLAAQLDVARLLCRSPIDLVSAHEFRRRVRAHLANTAVHVNQGIAWNSDRLGHIYPDLWFGFLGTFCALLVDSETNFLSILDPNLMSMVAMKRL